MSLVTIAGSDGVIAAVDEKRLRVRPQTDFEYALANGYAFSWSTTQINIDATDTILGVQNDNPTMHLYIQQILIGTATTSQMVVHTSSGVTMAGTAVTGVNLNRSSSYTALATAKSDESGNGQAAASYSGRLYTTLLLANTTIVIPVNGGIVIPYGHNIGIDQTADAANATAVIIGYYRTAAA